MRSFFRLRLKTLLKVSACLLLGSALFVAGYKYNSVWPGRLNEVLGGRGNSPEKTHIPVNPGELIREEQEKHNVAGDKVAFGRESVDEQMAHLLQHHNLGTNAVFPPDVKQSDSNPQGKGGVIKSFSEKFPRIMIVGFGKTGTRALFETLKMHPLLKGPTTEKRFFSDHYDKGLISYLKSLPNPPDGGVVIEKSPDYIIDRPAPSRIVASAEQLGIQASELKFVVMLRDPIDRAMSEYLEWRIARKTAHKPMLPPFDSMVMHKNGSINENQPFLKASNYQVHIKFWFKFFSQNQTCFVDGDKFIKNPYFEIHALESCLKLPPHFTPEHFVFDPKKGFYCFKFSPDQKEAHCMNSSKGRKHPDINSLVLERLKKYYQPFDDMLPPLVGREMLWQQKSRSSDLG